MEKYKKVVNNTYFNKKEIIDIDDSLNIVVYLEVDSPLNYGVRAFEYYGRIVKVTKCYFWIIEYCDGTMKNCRSDQIKDRENQQLAKKWHKKSIQKLYKVDIEEKNEQILYEKSH